MRVVGARATEKEKDASEEAWPGSIRAQRPEAARTALHSRPFFRPASQPASQPPFSLLARSSPLSVWQRPRLLGRRSPSSAPPSAQQPSPARPPPHRVAASASSSRRRRHPIGPRLSFPPLASLPGPSLVCIGSLAVAFTDVCHRSSHLVGRAPGRLADSLIHRCPQLARSLFVQTQTTPNPNSLQFIPGTAVLSSGGTHEFLTTKAALASPLALRLMGIEGVLSVFYGPDFVSVQKDEATPWSLIKPEVFSIIMEHFSSGAPLFRADSKEAREEENGEPEDTRILETDSEVVAMVKDLLATRIRPSIMEDGGDLEFLGMDEDSGIVKVRLKGSCRGCSSSAVTLKSGIERMLMHYVPEVTTVEQVGLGSGLIPVDMRARLLTHPTSCGAYLFYLSFSPQILDEEEQVALDEFAKFEQRLASKQEP